jgi:thiol-disulfide isomerase/thioredoxin
MKAWRLIAVLLAALCGTALAAPPEAGIRSFVRGSWQELRNEHAGRATVVHFWGVTCAPCRIEMPRLGEFLRQRPGLDLVLVDADLVPNERSAVAAMLAKAGLTAAENWLFEDDFEERLRYEVDPRWQGEIPLTILIARDGATTTLPGSADLVQIGAWLDAQKQAR